MLYDFLDFKTICSTFIGGFIGGAGSGVGAYLVVNHLIKRFEERLAAKKKTGGRRCPSSQSRSKIRK